jgi:hypothetical protein
MQKLINDITIASTLLPTTTMAPPLVLHHHLLPLQLLLLMEELLQQQQQDVNLANKASSRGLKISSQQHKKFHTHCTQLILIKTFTQNL